MTIRQELSKAANAKEKKGEDDSAYLQRLLESVNEMDDADYKKISKPAKTWVDAAIKAYNANEDLPGFSDEEDDGEKGSAAGLDEPEQDDADEEQDEAESESEEAGDEDMTETETVASRKRTSSPAAKKTASTAKKASEARGRKSGGTAQAAPRAKQNGTKAVAKTGGAQTAAKKLLAKNPDMTIDELATRLDKSGNEISRVTLSTLRSGFRHTLRVLQESGCLKKNMI